MKTRYSFNRKIKGVVSVFAAAMLLMLQGCNSDESIYVTRADRVEIKGIFSAEQEAYPMLNGRPISWDFSGLYATGWYTQKKLQPGMPINIAGLVENEEGLEEFVFTLHDLETDKELFRTVAKKQEDGVYRTSQFAYINGKSYESLDDYKYIVTSGMLINLTGSDLLLKTDMPGMDGGSDLQKDEEGRAILPGSEPFVMLGSLKGYYGKDDFNKEFTFTVIDPNSGKTLGTRKYKIGDLNDYKDNIYEYNGNAINLVVVPGAAGEPSLLIPPSIAPTPGKNQVGFYLLNENDLSNKDPYDLVYEEDQTIRFDNLIPGQWELRDAAKSIEKHGNYKLFNAGTTEPYAGLDDWGASMYEALLNFGDETGQIKWYLIDVSSWGVEPIEL